MLSPIAQQICEKRYFLKDENGKVIEDWDGLVTRVVNHVCKNENDDFKKQIFDLIFSTKFLPNSPCLANAGKKTKNAGVSACYVTKPPEDSWLGMVENIANFGHVARVGGGCGVDFSNIRPEGDFVSGSTHTKACGPIEHMRQISEIMSSITQSGLRGMAMMSTLRFDHPDIFKFINSKQKLSALKSLLKEDIFNHFDQLKDNINPQLQIILDKFISNFNISVVVTDDFMQKVEKDEDVELKFDGKIYQTVKARKIFNAIVEGAWSNGDPGLLFYNRMNDGPYKYSKQIITATNPCGEQMLPSFGVCNLGSIDVSKFYNIKTERMQWKELKNAIEIAIQFLDNVVDVNMYPTPAFEKWGIDNRPVGLGIMGWADLLLKMGIAYGSKDSLVFANELGRFFEQNAHNKSVELGKIRGTPKACQYSELEFRRNVTTISIAPTGTISLLANCSSSIEPIFSKTIFRYDNTGQYQMEHPDAKKEYFRCASDLSLIEHVDMQSVFQKHCDSGVSKTCNAPNSATIQDVADAYMHAWKSGTKGITIYRDGCKTTQVLNKSQKISVDYNNAPKRPKEVEADVFKRSADGFNWHILIGKIDNKPYELFALNGKVELPSKGKIVKHKKRHYSLVDINTDEVLVDNLDLEQNEIDPTISLETKRFSLELRHGIHPKFIVKQIDKTNSVITSFSKAVGRIFKTHYLTDQEVTEACSTSCPECAKEGKMSKMISEAGCFKCQNCCYSKCG